MAVVDTLLTLTSAGLTTSVTAYTSGDHLGTIWSASGFASAVGGTGVITGVTLADKADILGACTIYVFDTTVTVTDNGAPSWSDAEVLTMLGRIDVPPPDDLANNRVAFTPCWVPFKCTGASTTLFFAVITRTGHTFFGAVGDIQLRFAVTQTS